MLLPIFILGIIFIGVAFIPNEKNAKYLLAGYNTMSKEDQQKFDLKSFLIFFKRFHIFLGVSFILICLSLNYFNKDLGGLFLVYYPVVLYTLFLFRTQKFYSSSTGKLTSKIAIGIMIAVTIGLTGLLYTGYRESKISISNSTIEISGMYGEEIRFSDIKKVELVRTIPEVTYKANGFALGNITKGYFGTKSEGKVKLILDTRHGPYLYILKSDDSKLYFSSTNQDMEELAQEIKASIEN